MSKGSSGLFHGTTGDRHQSSAEHTIASRTAGLDLREHPRGKSLSARQSRQVRNKITARTATKNEYRQYMSDKRFAERRKAGVNEFWKQERRRIKAGVQPTRDWSDEQRADILSGGRPKYEGRTIQGHHSYSASRYPHLANRGEIIYPVTFDEHLFGWHGGNFSNSLPGKPIKYSKKRSFRRKK